VRLPADVTVIDRRNFHVFQPLLYQVATGGLSPGDIASALRWILRRQRNTSVWLGDVVRVDPAAREVRLADGGALRYDTLVVATGVTHHYFGHDSWESSAPGLKTLEDATEIRSRVLRAFEAAERSPGTALADGWLTFVVVGAGPTGVELAGAIAELARDTMRRDFRGIDPGGARVILVEGTSRVLPHYPEFLSVRARRSLERLGVTVRTEVTVTDVDDGGVILRSDASIETVPARTVLWAAGVRASPLGAAIADATGAARDRAGRLIVRPDLTIPGHPEIFVIGDLAHFAHQTGEPLPGVAPVAIQQGRHVADTIRRRMRNEEPKPFRYVNKGELATIGRAAAVANFGRLRFSGYPAWFLWLFVHLMYLVGFENRLLVFVQWAWNYVTRNRGARLIAHGWRGRDG
jgi:NADH:ubiquinone reductase (H+-translocating)